MDERSVVHRVEPPLGAVAGVLKRSGVLDSLPRVPWSLLVAERWLIICDSERFLQGHLTYKKTQPPRTLP